MTWVAANTRKKQSGSIASSTGWSRPSDWPVLPTVHDGDQKFVGLHAVFNHDSNFIALSATGAYTVDWGDGSAPENIASGVQANHVYDYATVSSQVTSRGYKTCVVTVIPQSGNLTGINLSKKHVQAGLNNYSTGWLEIAIGGVFSATGLVIGTTGPVLHRMLESIVSLFNTSAVTNMYSMFNGCYSLSTVNMANIKVSVSFSGCKMSKGSIVEVFNNLTTTSGQTITVSGNWGYTLLIPTDIEIATNKGWLVA